MQEKTSMSGRLFLGIPITEQARKSLKVQSWPGVSRYKNEKLVPTYNWHFTLAFLGNIPLEQLHSLKQLIEVFDWGKSFDLGIKNFGGFPEISNARILWAGIERGTKEIEELAQSLRKQLDNLGINYDQKPFVPHLTLCRMKNTKNLSRLKEDGKMKREIKFKADHFILYESLRDKHPYQEIVIRTLDK